MRGFVPFPWGLGVAIVFVNPILPRANRQPHRSNTTSPCNDEGTHLQGALQGILDGRYNLACVCGMSNIVAWLVAAHTYPNKSRIVGRALTLPSEVFSGLPNSIEEAVLAILNPLLLNDCLLGDV